jgi:hypothetical protein
MIIKITYYFHENNNVATDRGLPTYQAAAAGRWQDLPEQKTIGRRYSVRLRATFDAERHHRASDRMVSSAAGVYRRKVSRAGFKQAT